MGAVYEEEFNEFFQHQKKKDSRLSRAHGHQRGTTGPEQTTGQRQKETGCLIATGAEKRTVCCFENSCDHGTKFLSPG
jgi:hypothetical protein